MGWMATAKVFTSSWTVNGTISENNPMATE
jgi:hypothetical protein